MLSFFLVFDVSSHAQEARQKPAEKPSAQVSAPAQPQLPAQLELLETKIRFEANGDSRKEVHARVKINNELGARQFARLDFDFNRSFESVDIPLVRITHASGGTADILPSAIADNPNPAVVNAPAYQDVRVKSVRILGLAPGDSLEYRIITTVTKHPLAPDFWLNHSFDRTGVVSEEHFLVDLPASVLARSALIVVNNQKEKEELESRLNPNPGCGLCGGTRRAIPVIPAGETLPKAEYGKVQLFAKRSIFGASIERSGQGNHARVAYTWHRKAASQESDRGKDLAAMEDIPDIEIGRTWQWPALSFKLYKALSLPDQLPADVIGLARQLTAGADTPVSKTERIYDFVSQKIRTVDLPLGAVAFKPRALQEILSSAYATPEDKVFLFQGLAKAASLEAWALLVGPPKKIPALVVSPAPFNHIVVWVPVCDCWSDPSLEVAPFRMLPASYLGSAALDVGIDNGPIVDRPASSMIVQIPRELPFPSSQKVNVNASLDADGKLSAKVKYVMRGENELPLRLAFHRTPKEKWKEVAQLLALSDGFRGQITNVTASDPYATKEPFTVEYQIAQPKFVDWSRKPIRIPALLPQVSMPDLPAKPAPGAAASPIELGTPLDVETSVTLHLPPGTTAQTPVGTSVERDYASFSSKYGAFDAEFSSVHVVTITAYRHVSFLLREIPGSRAADYNAFLHAVQSDQAQLFTLDRPVAPPAKASSLTSPSSAGPRKTNFP